jgi:hypothetical protein
MAATGFDTLTCTAPLAGVALLMYWLVALRAPTSPVSAKCEDCLT